MAKPPPKSSESTVPYLTGLIHLTDAASSTPTPPRRGCRSSSRWKTQPFSRRPGRDGSLIAASSATGRRRSAPRIRTIWARTPRFPRRTRRISERRLHGPRQGYRGRCTAVVGSCRKTTLGGRYETSPSQTLAYRRRRCCAGGHLADCRGAVVSDTSYHDDRQLPGRGAADAVGRIIGGSMRASLGQPIVIENVTGVNGSIGMGRVA